MKIALIGYGKMGKTIEVVAQKRNHSIQAIIDPGNQSSSDIKDLSGIDVAIEFTSPAAAIDNINNCFKNNIPVVCGTTGWHNELDKVEQECKRLNGSLFYASNFSLGVNIFFQLNQFLAGIMESFSDYDIEMEEIHHAQKLDSPSGTAITLAEDILEKNHRKISWVNHKTTKANELGIVSKRIDKVPGTHTIIYNSNVDNIELKHTAKNRDGFALGAVLAAEFLLNKKGLYTMTDLLKI